MLLCEKWQIASLSCQIVISIWKQTWWSNDKIIIELGYCKISWFVRVAQFNYLQPPSTSANNWCAHHSQIIIFLLKRPKIVNCFPRDEYYWLPCKLSEYESLRESYCHCKYIDANRQITAILAKAGLNHPKRLMSLESLLFLSSLSVFL